jgi:DNA-binding LacI/PurR family transcriptional regulator
MPDRPKLQTVAQEAGVSTATVSQVLRGSGRISEETRKKVLSAARKVNYVPDGRAASMRSGEIREIGLVIQQIANPFNAEVISGVSDQMEAEGYLVMVLDSGDDPAKQRRNLEALIRSTRGGLLWVPAMDTPADTLELLRTHRIPTVTFLRRVKGTTFDHVGIENAEATFAATSHLANLGHRHIAFLGGIADVDSRNERIAGYARAMSERGLAPPIVWPCPDTKVAGMEAFIALREDHPEVTALVCNGDMVALGACLAMFRIGLRPGREVSVIGFDDVQDAAIATPPLSTLAVAPYDLGRRLAKVLLDRIRDPKMPQVTVTVPTVLTVRGTSGPPPA